MKTTGFRIDEAFVASHNKGMSAELDRDYQQLGERLQRRGIDIDRVTADAQQLAVALPSWAVGTGGTRFGRFPGPGEPRDVYEKIADCAAIHTLTRISPRVALHIPWDKPDDPRALAEHAAALGLGFDAMNSNTFEDQKGQKRSYKFGSLSHTSRDVREQAIAHNLECVEIGKALGSRALSIWVGDGGNFPGQVDFRKSLERYIASIETIYAEMPGDWLLYVEYKLYEPAFYSTVLNDWGTAYYVAARVGPRCLCLVDLGHHAPNVNIEMIVARLLQLEKLGGFHFNDSKYGDDDLDAGSMKPFQLFLIFHELVNGAWRGLGKNPAPAYMIDQSHNVTDPVESLISSAEEIQRAYVQALLVDRKALDAYQESNDAIMALRTLKAAFTTDVAPILATVRMRAGGAADPVAAFRASGYRMQKARERAQP
ncbi:MAG: L-rhamnose catabolism isomerase [Bacteroidota bacterium]